MNISDKQLDKVGVVILAAGDGKRMKSTLPKVMHELKGKPLIEHVVHHVEGLGFTHKPVIIVSPKHTMVQDHLHVRAEYVVQPEQLGTGHAVSVAELILENKVEDVVVLYGDMPFVSSHSIERLIGRHLERDNAITLMTFMVPHFKGVYEPFYNFGRVVRRGIDGHIARIVEKKDAIETELQILELNPSVFCFKASWLWKSLRSLKNENAQKEYYLTDLIQMAIADGEKISSISIEPKEAIGINTAEDLQLVREMK
jgi:bifunctional UDP-N-acetylglucosamine pyrophosphorylase/glucosamine-1-phosphate N-acetyltransferase